MSRKRELQKQLGSGYIYERYLDERSLRQLKRQPPEDFSEMVIAALTVGCLRLNAVLYRSDETLIQGYDVLVKDDPASPEWIFYDGISDTASPKEVEMLRILDGAARRHGLSYTESCFTRLDGKVPRKPKPRPKATVWPRVELSAEKRDDTRQNENAAKRRLCGGVCQDGCGAKSAGVRLRFGCRIKAGGCKCRPPLHSSPQCGLRSGALDILAFSALGTPV